MQTLTGRSAKNPAGNKAMASPAARYEKKGVLTRRPFLHNLIDLFWSSVSLSWHTIGTHSTARKSISAWLENNIKFLWATAEQSGIAFSENHEHLKVS